MLPQNKKSRFQNQTFKKQLENARGYKRNARKIPEKKFDAILDKFGLSSIWTKSALVIIILALGYIIYIPNFLKIKQIEITGIRSDNKGTIENTTRDFLKSKPYWPQTNLLLLSKQGLSKYILKKNTEVLKVESINKKFPNSLEIQISSRMPRFVLQSPDGSFIIFNDGKLYKKLDASATPESNLILIKIAGGIEPGTGTFTMPQETISSINLIQKDLPDITKLAIEYYKVESIKDPDLIVQLKSGYKIKFDTKLDTADVLKKTRLLLSEIPDTDQAKLEYLDMRINDRGYVCIKNAPCAKETVINNASTTIESIK